MQPSTYLNLSRFDDKTLFVLTLQGMKSVFAGQKTIARDVAQFDMVQPC